MIYIYNQLLWSYSIPSFHWLFVSFVFWLGNYGANSTRKKSWMATSPASNDAERRRCRRSLNSIEPRVSDSSWCALDAMARWICQDLPPLKTKKTKEKGDFSVHCSITRGKKLNLKANRLVEHVVSLVLNVRILPSKRGWFANKNGGSNKTGDWWTNSFKAFGVDDSHFMEIVYAKCSQHNDHWWWIISSGIRHQVRFLICLPISNKKIEILQMRRLYLMSYIKLHNQTNMACKQHKPVVCVWLQVWREFGSSLHCVMKISRENSSLYATMTGKWGA